nr:reverse transcriptase domain-containing protein [Tanacetum cinerariifolium]
MSRPGRTNSRDHPRGRSRSHRLDASNEGCPKDKERFCGVGESPWMCEEEDSFTPQIHNSESSRRTRMPNNVKTHDGTGDLEDHIKIFQAAAKVERFMHGVNNPKLTKRLNEHVPKIMEEMMITTNAFIQGEAATASKKKPKACKFQPPPPMVTPEKRSINKFCDFHNDKVHSTDECMQLKKQIKELVRAGKLSHLIKERIVTIHSTILIPAECATVITSSAIPKEVGARLENFKVALHPDFPDQEVAIKGTLSTEGRTKLCSLLKENLDIFAWQPSDMTGIQLAELDEEKTAFHTGQRVYCYIKMPFGLKKDGATYQRLMDKAFDCQIGQNIEVYVDDLVVKSHTEAEMLRDIGETFRTL